MPLSPGGGGSVKHLAESDSLLGASYELQVAAREADSERDYDSSRHSISHARL